MRCCMRGTSVCLHGAAASGTAILMTNSAVASPACLSCNVDAACFPYVAQAAITAGASLSDIRAAGDEAGSDWWTSSASCRWLLGVLLLGVGVVHVWMGGCRVGGWVGGWVVNLMILCGFLGNAVRSCGCDCSVVTTSSSSQGERCQCCGMSIVHNA